MPIHPKHVTIFHQSNILILLYTLHYFGVGVIAQSLQNLYLVFVWCAVGSDKGDSTVWVLGYAFKRGCHGTTHTVTFFKVLLMKYLACNVDVFTHTSMYVLYCICILILMHMQPKSIFALLFGYMSR